MLKTDTPATPEEKTPQKPNFTAADFMEDPYPTYQHMRAQCPFHKAELANNKQTWMVSRFEDSLNVLKDDARFTVDSTKTMSPLITRPMLAFEHVNILLRSMLNLDGEEHHRLRRLTQKAFTPRTVEKLRPHAQQIVDELLDQAAAKGHMEVMTEFAFPLPVRIISEMVGVPEEDRGRFVAWADKLMKINTLPSLLMAGFTMREFIHYFKQQFALRRQHPKDDLMTALVQIGGDDKPLTEVELVAMVVLILIAGYETTGNLITNSILALLQHPDQLAILQQNPALIENAVEEFLRCHSAIHSPVTRYAAEDVEIGGVKISKGESVTVVLASANRDESVYADAEKFDITRPASRHLAFGQGAHFCLGAALARLEAQIAIGTLVRRFPKLALATPQVAWSPRTISPEGGLIRTLLRLEVTV
jgi:cytochrome P450